jgi:hypothetical protein
MAGLTLQIPIACEWVAQTSTNVAAVLRNETALLHNFCAISALLTGVCEFAQCFALCAFVALCGLLASFGCDV